MSALVVVQFNIMAGSIRAKLRMNEWNNFKLDNYPKSKKTITHKTFCYICPVIKNKEDILT